MPLHYRSTNVLHRLQPTTPLLSLDMWSFLPSTVIYNVPPFAPHPNSQMDLSQVLSPQKQSHMTVFAYSSFVRLKILGESGEMICVWQENTADKPKWLVNHPSTYEKWMESYCSVVRRLTLLLSGECTRYSAERREFSSPGSSGQLERLKSNWIELLSCHQTWLFDTKNTI